MQDDNAHKIKIILFKSRVVKSFLVGSFCLHVVTENFLHCASQQHLEDAYVWKWWYETGTLELM